MGVFRVYHSFVPTNNHPFRELVAQLHTVLENKIKKVPIILFCLLSTFLPVQPAKVTDRDLMEFILCWHKHPLPLNQFKKELPIGILSL